MLFIRERSRTISPDLAEDPAARPVPAPRVTIGVRFAAATRMVVTTSSVDSANTTPSGTEAETYPDLSVLAASRSASNIEALRDPSRTAAVELIWTVISQNSFVMRKYHTASLGARSSLIMRENTFADRITTAFGIMGGQWFRDPDAVKCTKIKAIGVSTKRFGDGEANH